MTDQEKCELVAREFGALMEKHELAGMFVACAKTHATHSLLLESAPWVRLSIETDVDGAMIGIRIKSKIDDYIAAGVTKEVAETRQNQEMSYTINMLDMLSTQLGPVALLAVQMVDALEKRFHISTTSKRVGDATG